MSGGENLDDVASVRKRPNMYVGDTGSRAGTHQLFLEVLANAVNEHLTGRCSRIDVTLHRDGSATVTDDGAGISVAPDERGVPWLERVLTTLHDTPTADGHAVHLRRLAHVGLCMVSALSSQLSVEVRREGRAWRIELERGRVTVPLRAIGPARGTGTTVRFRPDETLFRCPELEAEVVAREVRQLSALLPGSTISFACEGQRYGTDLGVADLLSGARFSDRELWRPITGEARIGDAVGRVAFEWRRWTRETTVVGYCNLDPTPEGSHVEGFRRGLARALGRPDPRALFEALSPGLDAVVSVLVVDPTFRGPTRERIRSTEARDVVEEATARALEAALAEDAELREQITELIGPRRTD